MRWLAGVDICPVCLLPDDDSLFDTRCDGIWGHDGEEEDDS